MEGNDIEDQGGGQFRTVGRGEALQPARSVHDGAHPAERGADVLLRREPELAARRAATRRQIGVSFTGTRRDVLVDDVIAVNGARSPSSDAAPHSHPPGVHLRGQQRPHGGRGAGRQAGSHPLAVGGVLRHRHRGADVGEHAAALILRWTGPRPGTKPTKKERERSQSFFVIFF